MHQKCECGGTSALINYAENFLAIKNKCLWGEGRVSGRNKSPKRVINFKIKSGYIFSSSDSFGKRKKNVD